MQEESTRRTNRERTEATRTALIASARALFIEKGYAEAGTPEIAAMARVTRGALYHHFADKADVLRAVILAEAQTVAAQIGRETAHSNSALDALMAGGDAYFAAMAVAGRTRLLLLDGPSVLGHEEMDRINMETSGEELRLGLTEAMEDGGLNDVPLDALMDLLSAAFDRAALAIAEGRPASEYKTAFRLLLSRLFKRA